MGDGSMRVALADYQRLGWALVPTAATESELTLLDQQLSRVPANAPVHGLRDILDRCPQARILATSAGLKDIAMQALDGPVSLIRGVLLAKTPTANWHVPWHQDVLVTVRGAALTGAHQSHLKHGLLHLRPSEPWLSRRVALRLHLDDCPAHAGALRVLDGTHRRGYVPQHELSDRLGRWRGRVIPAQRGDILVMHPLLLHASSAAQRPGRRILHLEYCVNRPPFGTPWAVG